MAPDSAQVMERRTIVRRVIDSVMAGGTEGISQHFAPGAVIANRNNAGVIDAPWFDRLEGEYRLNGEEEVRSYLAELMRRTSYISYEPRGIVVDDDEAAARCDWTRQNSADGALVTGTSMYWFSFTSGGRIRSIESISSIHSVIPARREKAAAE